MSLVLLSVPLILVNWVVNNILNGEVGKPFNMYEETSSAVGNAGLVSEEKTGMSLRFSQGQLQNGRSCIYFFKK